MTTYLLSVHHDLGVTDEWVPEGMTEAEVQQSYEDTGKFNEELKASGHWVFAGGLEPPASATVVDNRQGANVITDGPYAETKEQLGGFWVIEAADLDEALAIAARGSFACKGSVEVRPFQGLA
ncbi:YciI family protein [Nocardioides marmorisolisilvae]|uniref:YciI family protein n=1 Tax=Nocardioides marmorisolisilvae TaxID=1542737 RepID=A0A3N0DT97_9ACTN|nr:YciI family protein [Nocardioides marmorisolisilvae]RNL78864.1 YciI family protein [Nocardioides marmorisolisilvae]